MSLRCCEDAFLNKSRLTAAVNERLYNIVQTILRRVFINRFPIACCSHCCIARLYRIFAQKDTSK